MKLKGQVESVLQEYARACNSDVELTLLVWWKFYQQHLEWQPDQGDTTKGRWMVPLTNVRMLPSEDKISRIRRKFQELGKYPATDPVVIARRSKEKKVRETINHSTWGENF